MSNPPANIRRSWCTPSRRRRSWIGLIFWLLVTPVCLDILVETEFKGIIAWVCSLAGAGAAVWQALTLLSYRDPQAEWDGKRLRLRSPTCWSGWIECRKIRQIHFGRGRNPVTIFLQSEEAKGKRIRTAWFVEEMEDGLPLLDDVIRACPSAEIEPAIRDYLQGKGSPPSSLSIPWVKKDPEEMS